LKKLRWGDFSLVFCNCDRPCISGLFSFINIFQAYSTKPTI
jgi:hypothetical protein